MDNTQFGGPRGANPDWGDNISSINPDDIEEITVLKGATAAALYGSKAKNGAIVITTKSGRGQEGIRVELLPTIPLNSLITYGSFRTNTARDTEGYHRKLCTGRSSRDVAHFRKFLS